MAKTLNEVVKKPRKPAAIRIDIQRVHDKIESIVKSGGQVGLGDPLSHKVFSLRNELRKSKKVHKESKEEDKKWGDNGVVDSGLLHAPKKKKEKWRGKSNDPTDASGHMERSKWAPKVWNEEWDAKEAEKRGYKAGLHANRKSSEMDNPFRSDVDELWPHWQKGFNRGDAERTKKTGKKTFQEAKRVDKPKTDLSGRQH